MKRTIVASLAFFLTTASLASAAVVFTGDCYPTAPTGWNSSTDGDIGTFDYTTGTVTVDSGSSLQSKACNIAAGGSTTGTLTVTGASSTFSAAGAINIAKGVSSTGELHVEAGGTVTSGSDSSWIGVTTSSDGLAVVTGANSTWTTGGSYIVGGSGATGTLNILDGGTVNSSLGGFSAIAYSNGAEGTVLISGENSHWNIGTRTFYSGFKTNTTGHLTITDNGLLTSGASSVGHNGTADATVSDGGTWNASGYVVVGYASGSQGSLAITDAGSVINTVNGHVGFQSGSTGAATVSNHGVWNMSSQLRVGNSGSGTLTIESGGVVNAETGRIGLYSGSTGAVTVTGTDSAWNNTGNMVVGWSGDSGSLTVTDNAAVTNTDGYIGYSDGYSGSVLISNGGTWNNSGKLTVGLKGNGTLNIDSGGVVSCTDGRLSDDPTATGTATVTGAGSQWNMSGYLLIGWDEGTGTLNIENGGAVTADSHVSLAKPGATGTLSLNGGSLTTGAFQGDLANIIGTGDIYAKGLVVDGDVVFDSTHGLNQTITGVGATAGATIHLDADGSTWMGAGYEGTGSLSVSDGIVLQSTGGTLGRYAGASATASVSGDGSAWNLEGTLNVGYDGAATLSIFDKGLVSASGLTIDDDIAGGDTGAVADSFIQMKTDGMLALFTDADENGTGDDLSASIADFLTAVAGSSSAIQWWDESSSNWASITTATLGTNCTLEYFDTGDLAGYTMLTVGDARIPGDANRDGKVDGSDVTILANNWQYGVVGGGATWGMGDFNEDGKVDGSDVTILANNWQKGVGAVSSAAVPEPSTLVLLLIGMVALPLIRRSKRS